MLTPLDEFVETLRHTAGDFRVMLNDDLAQRFRCYYELLRKWNPRLHLVAPCSPKEFATRHVLESLQLLPHLPANARVVDIGSGAGLPIIPCLVMRRDLHATLIESSQRKSVFLAEALRVTVSDAQAEVVADRFQKIGAPDAGFVTIRALERFQESLGAIAKWAPPRSTWLFFGGEALAKDVQLLRTGVRTEQIPGSERRLLIIAPPPRP